MNVVVTGGGTLAPIDDVRQIANASTGRFSAEIAEACLRKGAHVWHVSAPGAQKPFSRLAAFNLETADPDAEFQRLENLRREYQALKPRLHPRPLRVGSVAEYAQTLRSVLSETPIDLAFLAMAASDFEPQPTPGKIRSEIPELLLHCLPTPKVIQSVRDWAPGIFLVGFKLLSGSEPSALIAEAEAACRANRADATVANDLQLLRAGRHTVHLVRPGHPAETLGPGGPIAQALVNRVWSWVEAPERPHARPADAR